MTNPGGEDTATTLITVTEQVTPALDEDFESFDVEENPLFWLDQRSNTTEQDEYEVMLLQTNRVLGTDYDSNAIYSTYAIPGWQSWADYEYSGRMQMSDSGGEMAAVVYARFPEDDGTAYLLRNTNSNSFVLAAEGTTLTGSLDTGVTPTADTWYRFRVQVETGETATTLWARVWEDGTTEPGTWQATATDDTGSLISSGAVGVYGRLSGSKYFDDLLVTPLPQYTATTRVISYAYDDLYRLTEADYSSGEVYTYTYDAVGNRRSQTTLTATTVYTYDEANRLVNVDETSYTWDDNGNLQSDGSRTFAYDAANRLISVTNTTATTHNLFTTVWETAPARPSLRCRPAMCWTR